MRRLLVAVLALAVGLPAAAADLIGAHRARARDLLDDTEQMSASERGVYLRALVNADREPEPVEDALERALAANEAGKPYEEILDAAIGKDSARADVAPAPPPLDALPPVTPSGGDQPHDDLDAATLRAMREYKVRRLHVSVEQHWTGGGQQIISNPYGWGGGVVVTRDPVTVTRTWAVYEGPVRLDVPRYLDLVGRDEDKRDLEGRISRKKWLSRTYYGVAVGGVAAIVAGSVGRATADTSEEAAQWGSVGAAGLGATVIGLIGGSFPAATANRLRTDFPRVTDIRDAQVAADAYNEELRVELGLTPDQALRVEEQAAEEPIDRYDMR